MHSAQLKLAIVIIEDVKNSNEVSVDTGGCRRDYSAVYKQWLASPLVSYS